MTWIPRFAEDRLKRLAGTRPVVVVTGARQTGKTSLARRLFPDYEYVTLDLPSEAAQAENDPEAFLRRHPAPVIIDEVQYAPGLFRHLKAVIDADRNINGRFILTGSQKFSLMQGVSESLAGRAGLVELEGISLEELRNAEQEQKHSTASVEHVIARGAMPELWEKPELDAADFYQAYLVSYLERDLRALLEVGNLRDFERFLRACALRSGQILNKAELARDVGIHPTTAAAWLSVLEASNQVQLLEPWFANGTKSLVKSPKLYVCDTGLLCYLLGVRKPEDLLDSPYAGAVWETFVCAELRKKLRKGDRGDLFFWSDRTREVDFLIHKAGKFELLDAKWSTHPDSKAARALWKVRASFLENSVRRMALVCRTPHAFPLVTDVQAVPAEEA